MTQQDIASQIQLADAGEIVTLFILDATVLGGGVYYFTSMSKNNAPVVFQGHTFTPIDMETEGWEISAQGSLPQPKIRISNAGKVMASAVREFKDILGATLTRIRTFSHFLDGETGANPDAQFMPDIYKVERKSSQTRLMIEWELSAAIDQEGRQLPGRQFLKDSCTKIYRTFSAGAFDYSKATCPYDGTSYFLTTGAITADPAADRCGKKLSDCRLRFGQNGILPFGGFPGIGRTQRG